MKKIKKLIIYLRIWLIYKMGYTLPSLREMIVVMPGKLYDHFSYIVMAVPVSGKHPSDSSSKEERHQCQKCELFMKGIPCGFSHRMPNGKDICDNHVFKVICKNTHRI